MRRPHQLHPEQHGPTRPNRHDQRRHPARPLADTHRELRTHHRGDRTAVLSSPFAELSLERRRSGNLHHPAHGVRGSAGAFDARQRRIYHSTLHRQAGRPRD